MVRREENKIDTLKSLLHTLSDGRTHSGVALGKSLGITRAAIWKLIQTARSLDFPLESIPSKGYCLKKPAQFLDKNKIRCYLSAPYNQLLEDILIFDALDSTNDYLLNHGEEYRGNVICLAEQQNKGRGRKGRPWVSPFGKNVYLSLLWRFSKDLSELSGLSLAIAVAVAKTLESYTKTVTKPLEPYTTSIPKTPEPYTKNQGLGLKWPNDILFNFKKLAGILIDIHAEANTSTAAIIGIGINVSMPKKWTKSIKQPVTDLEEITDSQIDRNELVGKLANELVRTLATFQEEGFKSFIPEFTARDLTNNRVLNVITPKGSFRGKGLGVNSNGHLVVEMQNNQIQTFANGEVSIQVAN